MEAAQQKVNDAVQSMMDDIDKKHLRKMQADMHDCAKKCCLDTKASAPAVQNCVEQCQSRVQQASQQVESEMQGFQDRLTRCAKSCDDKAKDVLGARDPASVDLAPIKAVFEECLVKCADEHVGLLPSINNRILGKFKQL